MAVREKHLCKTTQKYKTQFSTIVYNRKLLKTLHANTDNKIHKAGVDGENKAEATRLHQKPLNRLLNGLDLLF